LEITGGAVSLTGEAVVGGTLVASVSGFDPAPDALTYQWASCEQSGLCHAGTSIGGNTSTYVIQPGDLGRVINLMVTASITPVQDGEGKWVVYGDSRVSAKSDLVVDSQLDSSDPAGAAAALVAALPTTISSASISDVIAATKAIASLSESELSGIPTDVLEKLADAQAQAGTINHSNGAVQIYGDSLPWYVALSTTGLAADHDQFQVLANATPGWDVLVLYDLVLTDLITSLKWEPAAGQTVTVVIAEPTMAGHGSIKIAYLASDGSVEILDAVVSGSAVTFTTSHFSHYGVIANTFANNSENSGGGAAQEKDARVGGSGVSHTNGTGAGGNSINPSSAPGRLYLTGISATLLATSTAAVMLGGIAISNSRSGRGREDRRRRRE